MSRITLLAVVTFALALVAVVSSPVSAQHEDPVATAQAAERRANQLSGAAWSARSTADAAYAQATAQSAEATRQAQALATAQAQRATSTAVSATAQAQATRQAVEVEATRVAIYAQATRQAHAQQVEATATTQALRVQATRAAAFAEHDQLALRRARVLQPLYSWGPWLLVGALLAVVGALLYQVLRSRPEVEGGGVSGSVIEAEYYDASGGNGAAPAVALLAEEAGRCVLRPIDRRNDERSIYW